jgi:hypothetical protein
MENPLRELANKQLACAFRQLNNLFIDKLPLPTFVVNPKKNFIFRFEGEPFHIVIGSGFEKAVLREILDDLLHQMCHVVNHVARLRDTTIKDYHNRKFLNIALSVGLTAIKDKNYGWATTSDPQSTGKNVVFPPAEFNEKREEIFQDLAVEFNTSALTEAQEAIASLPRRSSKNYFLKYTCSCDPPHNSFRSGRRPDGAHSLNVLCMDCLSLFKCVEMPLRKSKKSKGVDCGRSDESGDGGNFDQPPC